MRWMSSAATASQIAEIVSRVSPVGSTAGRAASRSSNSTSSAGCRARARYSSISRFLAIWKSQLVKSDRPLKLPSD